MATTKFYITKFALTKGIYAVEGHRIAAGMVQVPGAYPWQAMIFGMADANEDLDVAKRRAEAMRQLKIKQLEQEIKRLAGMEFKLHDYPEG